MTVFKLSLQEKLQKSLLLIKVKCRPALSNWSELHKDQMYPVQSFFLVLCVNTSAGAFSLEFFIPPDCADLCCFCFQSNLAKLKSQVSHFEEENILLQSEIKKLESQVLGFVPA